MQGQQKSPRGEGRKRTYELTDAGRALYDAECARLRRCIRDADREEENT